MNGLDPNSGAGGIQTGQKPVNQAEAGRELEIQGKTAKVGKKKHWILRAISVLLHPGKWKRSSRSDTKTIAPQRFIPPRHEQSPTSEGTAIHKRRARPATSNEVSSVQNRTPEPRVRPSSSTGSNTSVQNRPLPKPPGGHSKPELPPKPATPTSPQQTTTPEKPPKPADLPRPQSLEELVSNFEQDKYTNADGKVDEQVVREHLRELPKDTIRPLKNPSINQLPPEGQQLAREVYAEKKVQEEIARLPTGSDEELQGLRTRLGNMFTSRQKKPTETTRILVAEFDRQVEAARVVAEAPSRALEMTDRLSATLQAKSTLPQELQKTFPDIRINDPRAGEDPFVTRVVEDYKDLRSRSPVIADKDTYKGDPTYTRQAVPKYLDVTCERASCAANPDYLYNCNTVQMSQGSYVAAQGCTEKTEANFISTLAHQNSPLSVSLVSKRELDAPIVTAGYDKNVNKRSVSVGPQVIGEEKEYNGIKVRLDNQLWLDDGNIRVDVLNLDGQPHFRVYDTGWEDHTSGDPSRLAALSVLVEQLRQDPAIADRKDNPTVVNCNAGIGRTGTFITLNNSTREFLNTGQVDPDFESSIIEARHTRKNFVQTPGQHNALKALYNDLPSVLTPLASAAGLDVNGAPVNPSAQTSTPETITDIDETYENFEAVRPQRPVSPELSNEDPVDNESDDISPTYANVTETMQQGSGIVSTASQFMERYNSGYYSDHPEPWQAVELDISTIYSTSELGRLEISVNDLAKADPRHEEAAETVLSLIEDHRRTITGPGNAIDNINRPTGQIRNQ